jgi:DNA-binding transcriptional ArsR family regulator
MEIDSLTTTFAALADPTRRAILGRLTRGETSKHLKVLQHAGLIARSRKAQWRPCRLSAIPLKDVADWVNHYRQFWEQSFDRLDQYLKDLQTKEKKHARKK